MTTTLKDTTMNNKTKELETSTAAANPMEPFVMWLYSEVLWLLRRSPVVLATILTWNALDVGKDIDAIVMVVCAFGYFAVHHYLKWIEARYEQPAEDKDDFPLSHEACDAFWDHWKKNGETHKHGYYESTWGAIRAYLKKAETTKNHRAT